MTDDELLLLLVQTRTRLVVVKAGSMPAETRAQLVEIASALRPAIESLGERIRARRNEPQESTPE